MNGVIVVDKPKGITSRDVVNKVCKVLKTKKVGHTGTLDPIATGVLVICIGKATKLVEVLTLEEKEYVATVKLGILTDTLDTDGKIIKEEKSKTNKQSLIKVLNSFIGTYNQEVPIYSAIKIKGKKLYEYARSGKNVKLPKRKVIIKNIELLEFRNNSYKFKVSVSKGTYIRSLIKDINDKLGIIGVMSDLKRTKQGKFNIEDSYSVYDIINGEYKLLTITDVLQNEKIVIIDQSLFNKIKHGSLVDNIYGKNMVYFMYNNEIIAIYKVYDKDNRKLKPYKMFI